ncbi:ABC transporter ATP-binding protein [Streptomyces sp. NPDC056061]|uniref:ABC transporter ATP-binding protein n=1 Tax=Streptomyces sp. NPDC056061 TaxID=3345700 RepID=UPI0035DA79BE
MPFDTAQARRILALFAPYRSRLFTVVGLIVVASSISLSSPFLIREIIDTAIPQRRGGLLSALAVGMLAVITVTESLQVWQAWMSTTVGQRVINDLRVSVYSHLHRLSLNFFIRTHSGELQSRIANDIGGVQSFVTNTAAAAVNCVTTLLATAVAMFVLDWRLACISLALLPVVALVSLSVGRARRRIMQTRQEKMASLTSHVDESLSVDGIVLGRTMGRSAALVEKFAVRSRELADLDVRAAVTGRWRIAQLSIAMASLSVFLYWGAGLASAYGSSSLSIGTLVAFVTLQAALLGPAMSLAQLGVELQTSLALFTRIFEYLDQEPEVVEKPTALSVPRAEIRGSFRLRDVDFRYSADAEPALRGISLDIPAGSRIAIAGETGSGKSTLARLLARLYDPTRGRVTLDGEDLRDLTFETLSDAVAVVSQDPFLFHASIAENLRIAKPDAEGRELMDACAAAGIHARISELPDGYDTTVGERGHQLSGGEKQRLSIARALLRDAPVLVFDEATSALDSRTERDIQQSLDRVSEGRTVITIAHRLSTIRDADRIAVLHRGRLVEFGSHDELVASGGKYADLWTLMHRAEPHATGEPVG